MRTTVGSLARLSCLAAVLAIPSFVEAQSLRGSRTSINRMYRQALAEDFSFLETPASVRKFVSAGLLVRLSPDSSFRLHDVTYPYVRPALLTFVQRLGTQYRNACGEQMVVTSAVRPATRQPYNSTELSVHPTGMAVDLRKPRSSTCLKWLRSTLLELEKSGLLEATEEHSPAHFHVAVFPTAYTRHVAARVAAEKASEVRVTVAADRYTVRNGDTLWDIARVHDTSVEALLSANRLEGETIRPGQELLIPSGN